MRAREEVTMGTFVGGDETLAQHLEWCREVLADNERRLVALRQGHLKLSEKIAGSTSKDITSDWIETLGWQNAALRKILKDTAL